MMMDQNARAPHLNTLQLRRIVLSHADIYVLQK
jgi:hypothetical protein